MIKQEEAPLLSMRGITKRFPGVVALQDVSLSLYRGEVLALMGENGAGKSTLMKILGGAQAPDEGHIEIDGKRVTLDSVRAAKNLGIALIHQELMLAGNLDITANIFLGSERPRGGMLLPLPRPDMKRRARELMQRVGLSLSPSTLVSNLTAGQMQMVEIAKALALDARILILDEPTSSLTNEEAQQLFVIVNQLRDDGLGIVYISHRLDEVTLLADRVTVLRDGQYVGDLTRSETTQDKIVAMMVGRELSQDYFPKRADVQLGEVALEAEDLLVPGAPSGVSFSVARGEILGFAGLVGAGRTELMQTIFGVTPALSGRILVEGKPVSMQHPEDAIRAGVFLAPEDRKQHGVVLGMSIAQNTSLPAVGSYARFGWLDRKTERRIAGEQRDRLRIKTPNLEQKVVNLSGGNQQKVVLAKWLAMDPKVLILDEPTRGIDVGAKAEIYREMDRLARSGIAVIMVSSDMEEILGMSDRIVVMQERTITGSLRRGEATQEAVAALMTGTASRGGVAA